jgi:AcrR family transcriptional regulator
MCASLSTGEADLPAPSRRNRSTRDRPAKTPLSEEAIVDVALAINRSEGLAAVTMRRVAKELDTGAASLYVYVGGRDELVRLMLDRVLAIVPLVKPDPARWREQVYELTLRARDALEMHPGMSSVLLGEPPITDGTMNGAESLLAILLAGGITGQDAAWACDILMLIMTASATEADVRRAAGFGGFSVDAERAEIAAHLRAQFMALSPERHPLLIKHADEMVAGEIDERFRFAIETFLDGLVARSARAR